MSTYTVFEPEDAPTWLQGASGQALLSAYGACKELVSEAAKFAVYARHPDLCSEDSLARIARDRNVDIGYRENAGQMRNRLRHAWTSWSLSGRKAAIPYGLSWAGYENTYITEATQDGSLRWWEFDVWLVYPFPWADGWRNDGLWDDPGVWDDGGTWPYDVPPNELELVRSIVRKWKTTHSLCRRLVFVHAGDFWDNPIDTWLSGGEWHEDVSIFTC